jgi:hypothetical protein
MPSLQTRQLRCSLPALAPLLPVSMALRRRELQRLRLHQRLRQRLQTLPPLSLQTLLLSLPLQSSLCCWRWQ